MTKPKKAKPKASPKKAADPVATTIAFLRKELGGDAAATLRDGCRSEVKDVLPTGIAVLDHHVLGIGGMPYGRIVEVSGKESCGKSSLAWQVMGRAQQDGALVVFAESEPAIAPAWVDSFGVNRGNVVSLGCAHFEQFEHGVHKILGGVTSAKKMVFILDSVDSLQSEEELIAFEKDKDTMGVAGKKWSQFLRRVSPMLAERNALMLLLNQTRARIGSLFGAKEQTTGGNAIRFYSSIRLTMWADKVVANGATKIGRWSGVEAKKNKLAPPLRAAKAYLSFDGGWRDDMSTLIHAREMKVIGPRDKDVAEARSMLGWPAGESGGGTIEDEIGGEEPEPEAA